MFIVAVEVDDGDFFGSIIVISMNAWDGTHRMSINLANRSLHSCLADIDHLSFDPYLCSKPSKGICLGDTVHSTMEYTHHESKQFAGMTCFKVLRAGRLGSSHKFTGYLRFEQDVPWP
jgi:hypothetical protein